MAQNNQKNKYMYENPNEVEVLNPKKKKKKPDNKIQNSLADINNEIQKLSKSIQRQPELTKKLIALEDLITKLDTLPKYIDHSVRKQFVSSQNVFNSQLNKSAKAANQELEKVSKNFAKAAAVKSMAKELKKEINQLKSKSLESNEQQINQLINEKLRNLQILTSIPEHNKLPNLLWSKAGHEIDTDLDLAENKIINLKTPTDNSDAATKKYVDDSSPTAFDYVDVVFVGKHGDDSNDGLNPEQAVLTLNRAETIAESLTNGSNRVLINILDAGIYNTGNLTVDDNIDVWGENAVVDMRLVMRDDTNVRLYKIYDDGSAFPTINKNAGTDNASVHAPVIDMRGINGNVTGGVGIRNVGGGGILVVRADKFFVSENGVGVGDKSGGFGHIHLDTEDLYLAGDNAIGIQSLNSTASIIIRAGHILEIGSPTGTTAIDGSISGSKIYVTTNQIVADTAINVASGAKVFVQSIDIEGNITVASGGELYIDCDSFSGTITNNGTIQGRIGDTLYGQTIAEDLDIDSDKIRVRNAKTPANASDIGNQGDIAWDSNYIYICTATNTWKRAALATW